MRPVVVIIECRSQGCRDWLAAAPRERLSAFLERARGSGWETDPDRCPTHRRARLSVVEEAAR